jgi:ATP-dependent 26S proteasome regulatory subunit
MPVNRCCCGSYEYKEVNTCRKCGRSMYGTDQNIPQEFTRPRASNSDQSAKRWGLALNHVDPTIARTYRNIATVGARSLPDYLDWTLLTVWIADTRGESFSFAPQIEDYFRALEQSQIMLKENLETAARQGKVDFDAAKSEWIDLNVCWALTQDGDWKLHEAIRKYFAILSQGNLELAPLQDLKAARETCKMLTAAWLDQYQIPHYKEESVSLPATRLLKALKKFEGSQDVHFAPAIPADKLQNARSECGVPDDEDVAILVDCTFFGSAKHALLFGLKSIYFHNDSASGFLPYSQFSRCTFNVRSGNNSLVALCEGLSIDLSGSELSVSQCISMLEVIRKEAAMGNERKTGVGLQSIPGMHSLKQTLTEDIIDVLRNADEYKKYGLALPNGVLFYGPPGCGKTFIAQHLAKELDYNFYEISPSSVASPYIHDTVLKIKDIFDSAARSAPSVIFVDEFEGLVPSRRYLSGDSHHKAEEVNEWLTQIGTCSERKILFIAATNEPWKIDEAIRRTGRLDKKLFIGPPDQEAIKEMIAYHCQGRPVEDTEVAQGVALLLEGQGYSASDLKALADEAAKMAMKDKGPITLEHFQLAATEKVLPSITEESQAMFFEFR